MRSRKLQQQLDNCTPNDRMEVERFEQYLKDAARMTPLELIGEHWEYMGFSEEEARKILNEPAEQ